MSLSRGSLVRASLIDRTIAFTTAFSLEAMLFSGELWAKLPVGIILAMVTLLVFWCVSIMLTSRADFCVSSGVHVLKDRIVDLIGSLRGELSEPGPDARNAGGDDDRGMSGMLYRLGALKEAFNRLRRPRRPRALASPTFVNPTGGNRRGTQDATTVEMGEINNIESVNAV